MKNYFNIFLFVFLCKASLSQNEFKIFIGGGFEKDEITLIGSFYNKGELLTDTIIFKTDITSNPVNGLGKALKAKYNKNSRYDLTISINEKIYSYQTDKLCNKSELRIEYYHDIDLCFLYKGGFTFY